jgi:hypothetical protein
MAKTDEEAQDPSLLTSLHPVPQVKSQPHMNSHKEVFVQDDDRVVYRDVRKALKLLVVLT